MNYQIHLAGDLWTSNKQKFYNLEWVSQNVLAPLVFWVHQYHIQYFNIMTLYQIHLVGDLWLSKKQKSLNCDSYFSRTVLAKNVAGNAWITSHSWPEMWYSQDKLQHNFPKTLHLLPWRSWCWSRQSNSELLLSYLKATIGNRARCNFFQGHTRNNDIYINHLRIMQIVRVLLLNLSVLLTKHLVRCTGLKYNLMHKN